MLVKRFEEQVKKSPDQWAIRTSQKSFAYAELNSTANRIAHIIKKRCPAEAHIQMQTLGLLLEHGPQMIVALFAALKAGKIYVPLSPDYPQQRLAYMISHSQASLILTDTNNRALAGELAAQNHIPVINLDEIGDDLPRENPARDTTVDKSAYILYTSGSTGKPKGVVQTHKNVLYFIDQYTKNLSIDENDRMTLLSSFSHDAAVMDIFGALLKGAELYPLDIKKQTNIFSLPRWINEQGITVWHSVPTVYRYLIKTVQASDSFPALRLIVLGGEEVLEYDVEMCRQLFPPTTLCNLYGQTESSYNASQLITPAAAREEITLGETVAGTAIFVVDEYGNEVGALESGEIIIAGPHVSPGYWRDDESTGKSFYEDPEHGRLYLTGDIGRRLLDGRIEFIGRKDFQVKIRGYRVELGEIESRLHQHQHIRQAAITIKTRESSEKYLCAYLVPVPGRELAEADLREYLALELPGYMIPDFFVTLEKLPLTPSGKIDRQALPAPGINMGKSYTAPRHEIEEKLAAIWSEIFAHRTLIGIDDNFFHLGGHSLKAAVLVSKIHKELEVEVPLAEVFKRPTIRGLSQYIMETGKDKYFSIQSAEEKKYYRVTHDQRRMYILNALEGLNTAYNISGILQIQGQYDKQLLEQAFALLVNRHESLRTYFILKDGEPVQIIAKKVDFEVNYIHSGNTGSEPEGWRQFIKSFDLSKPPLFRIGVLKTAGDKHLLIYDMHHIIADGISQTILVRDFVDLYLGKALQEIKIRYKDFSEWQNKMSAAGEIKKQEKYWLKHLKGELPVLNMPTDYPRPRLQSFKGSKLKFRIEEKLEAGLNRLCRDREITLYMLLLAAYNLLLSRYTGQEDIIVGSPIAGRNHADLENTAGLFIKTIVTRNYPAGDKKFDDFLQEIKANTLQAYANQGHPFGELVSKIDIKRDPGRNPLFDAMFIVQNMDYPGQRIDNLEFTAYEFDPGVSRVDLTLEAAESGDGTRLSFEYCTKLFKKDTVERMAKYFLMILNEIIENPNQRLSNLEIMHPEDKNKILAEFNNTRTGYPENKTLPALFREQAVKTPHNTAIVYEDQCLTYSRLDEKADFLAGILKEKGLKADITAGIMVKRSLEMIIGLLAILKAGGAYLPIDPDYPRERIEYMLEDSGVQVLLTDNLSRDFNCRLSIEELAKIVKHPKIKSFVGSRGDFSKEPLAAGGTNLAYIIYTSGSTGKPKGVMIEHRNVVNFITGITAGINFSPGKTIAAITTICFDIFVLETFVPLLNGLKVIIVSQQHQRDPQLLAKLIVKNNINMLQVTPSSLKLLVNSDKNLSSLEKTGELMIGGETLPTDLFETLKTKYKGKIYNLYGPTETTVWSSIKDLTGLEEITVGKPIANTQVYILDGHENLQPIGVVGELFIGGDGLARGYLNKPDLSNEKFCLRRPGGRFLKKLPREASGTPRKNFPLNTSYRSYRSYISYLSYIYRTGDLARWQPDGNIELLGRIDHQVKIRGFRIELGDIESQLLKHEDIKEAIVIINQDENREKHLAAYIISGKKFQESELRDYLAGKLPGYMIPSYFVQLEAMPLTPNGKVDRKALLSSDVKMTTGKEYAAPVTQIEKILARAWQEVLNRDNLGIHDNFFDLGGTSMEVIHLNNKLKELLNIDIPVAAIYRYMTISSFSQYLTREEACMKAFEQEANRAEEIKRSRTRLQQKMKRMRP